MLSGSIVELFFLMKGEQIMDSNSSRLTAVQTGIILATLATALIHISLLFPDVLFILNGLGYLALLGAYFMPVDLARRYHNLIRWAYIGFASVTILAWIAIGDKSWPEGWLGYLTKLIEVVLIVLLLVDRRDVVHTHEVRG
jgi:hypothetical protein